MASQSENGIPTNCGPDVLRKGRCAFSVVCGLMLAWAAAPCRAEDDPNGEMAKIAAAHKHWRESIVSVRFVWKTTCGPNAPVVKGTKYEGVKRTSTEEFIWCDDGRFRLHMVGQHNDGPEILRSLRCGNGQRSYSVSYDDGPSELEKPQSIGILPQPTPGQGGGMVLVPLEGLWFSHRLYWLSEMISRDLVKFDGYADVMGEKMPRVKIEHVTPDFVFTVTLNPQKGYLPRVFDYGPQSGTRIDILSYREIEPTLWFPWTGSFVSPFDPTTWEMKEIQVNSDLDPKLFEPPRMPGTVVVDVVNGERTVQGVASHRSDIEEQIAQNAKRNLAAGGNPVTALPPRGGMLLWIVVGSIVSLILAAATFAVRRRG